MRLIEVVKHITCSLKIMNRILLDKIKTHSDIIAQLHRAPFSNRTLCVPQWWAFQASSGLLFWPNCTALTASTFLPLRMMVK